MMPWARAIPTRREEPVISTLSNQPVAHPAALRPFDPGRLPFYYGWIIMAVSALGILFSMPGQTMGVSVFTDHLLQALGLSRIRISTAYMIGTFTSALLMTRAGRLYDRLGARTSGAGAVVGLALGLLYFTRIDRTADLAARWFGGGEGASMVSGFILVTLGFLVIRFFGQGVLTLVSRTMMMRWFEERRGRVAAYSGITVSAGFAYAPRLLQSLIDGRGWREAWAFLALILLAVALPVVVVFFRDTPERCGIPVEHGLRHLRVHKARHDLVGADATLSEARRDRRYWAYAFLVAWWSLFYTAFTFHVIDIFASRGVDASRAVAIFLPITVITVTVNVLGSWLSDAIDLPPLYYLTVLGFGAAGVGIMNPGAAWSPYVLIVGLGLGGGLWNVLNTVSWPRLFGREHLGEINGSVMSLMVGGSAVGPLLFSVLRSPGGSYIAAGLLGILGSVALGAFGLFAFSGRRPVRPASRG